MALLLIELDKSIGHAEAWRATFKEQQISESGRQLAVKLLRQLTPQQLNTLFEASGITAFPHIAAAAKAPQNWTNAFLDKVGQIERAGPCPNP